METVAAQIQQTDSNRGEARRRGRGSRARQQLRTQNHAQPPARPFGGQLTRLHADAPPFVPVSLPSRPDSVISSTPSESLKEAKQSRPQQQKHKQRKASISRSTAPDLATRTHEDIRKGIYVTFDQSKLEIILMSGLVIRVGLYFTLAALRGGPKMRVRQCISAIMGMNQQLASSGDVLDAI